MDDTELRPAFTRTYSTSTLACYRRRLVHYQRWCHLSGYQAEPQFITPDKVLAYVDAQIERCRPPKDTSPREYMLLRPDTLYQAVSALMYYSERVAPVIADSREAKELIKRWRDEFEAVTPPLWRVAGRRGTRPRRPAVKRPRVGEVVQGDLFSS